MQQKVLRKTIEQLFLKSVRFYTFNTPISKGKYRLYQKSLELCRYPPTGIKVRLRDGRQYLADLTDEGYHSVFFLGEFERAVTDIISSVVKKNDVCLDVGANFGWYTTLLHRLIAGGARFTPLSRYRILSLT